MSSTSKRRLNMSKLWSGVLAVCLVFTSVAIIAELAATEADAEDAYVKYDVSGENTNTWSFAPLTDNAYSGNAKVVILGVDGNNYDVRMEENVKGTFDVESRDISQFEIGVEGDYKLTDSRVGIGEKTTYVWECKDDTYTYQVCSDKKLDLGSIYRLTAIEDSDDVYEKHVIDFKDDGTVKSWTFERKFVSEKTTTDLIYLMDIPDGTKLVSERTHFGVRDVAKLPLATVDAKTGLILEGIYGGDDYVLISTNIRL